MINDTLQARSNGDDGDDGDQKEGTNWYGSCTRNSANSIAHDASHLHSTPPV